MSKVIVLLSGGMDSATVLAHALSVANDGDEVIALNMHYGQRHNIELECARNIAKYYDVEYIELDISSAFKNISSALLPHSGIEIDDNQDKNQIGSTYVPGRNIIFLSIAAGIADSIGAQYVYYGAHRDDHSGYPDCTVEFFKHMTRAVYAGTKNEVTLMAPYIFSPKRAIVEDGMRYGVPFELTHSCYRGERPACGTCPTCKLRLEAFKEAGYEDPIEYREESTC
jgi:7-cyano-7-deazaguanine synthase